MEGEAMCQSAREGDLETLARLFAETPGLINARDPNAGGRTPLMEAAKMDHLECVQWLLDRGAGFDSQDDEEGTTALIDASGEGHTPIVRLLLSRGADPALVNHGGYSPLMAASCEGRLEVVRCLLGLPSGKATIHHRDAMGETALWGACYRGHGPVVRVLLEEGADPTIAAEDDTTPMAVALQHHRLQSRRTGRRECVAALKVRTLLCCMVASRDHGQLWYAAPSHLVCIWRLWTVIYLYLHTKRLTGRAHGGWQESERAYSLWRAREVADQQGGGAIVVGGGRGGQEGEAQKAILDFALHRLKGDLFPDLMELMG
jgi:hypothetical protein